MKKGFRYWFLVEALLLVWIAQSGWTQSASKTTGFDPLDRWGGAGVAGDAWVLKNFYSSDPPAQVDANGITRAADADVSFWLGLKARGMNLEIVRLKQRLG